MYYVLMETEDTGAGVPLGVFDTSDIKDEKLSEYYGAFSNVDFMDIRDSGIVWQKTIKCDGKDIILTLHYFKLNEV